MYTVRASSPRRNRLVTGEVTDSVDGVPASPVNSFVYDGVGSESIKGRLKMELDPIENVGLVKAWWKDEHGRWTLRMNFFVHPHHPSGLRVAPDAFEEDLVILDPIATNVYLHGNSTAGLPVVPTVFTSPRRSRFSGFVAHSAIASRHSSIIMAGRRTV